MSDAEIRAALHVQLEQHESKRSKPYLDCCGKPWRECVCVKKGKLSIGIGRNLDDVGLRDDEIYYLLDNDINAAQADLRRSLIWYVALSDIRKRVLIDMCFNMGIGKLLTFTNTLAAMAAGQHESVYAHMLASLWAKQVGQRARRLAEMWRSNKAALQ